MSEQFAPSTSEQSSYRLGPKSPVRSYLVAAAVLVGGGYLLFANLDVFPNRWSVMGILLCVVGVAFLIVLALSMPKSAVVMEMTATDFTVTTGGETKSGTWNDVTRMAVDPQGTGFVLALGKERVRVIAPNGVMDPVLPDLIREVKLRWTNAKRARQGEAPIVVEGGKPHYVQPDEADNSGFDTYRDIR